MLFRSRGELVVVVAASAVLACGPEPAVEFVGDYEDVVGDWSCTIEHPEAPTFSVGGFYGERSIEEFDDDTLVVDLPMPPCPLAGRVDGAKLRLTAEDCVVDIAATELVEAHSVEYEDGSGIGEWVDGVLEIRTETRRRYLSIPNDLPEWWDDPGHCMGSYVLTPI